MTIDGLKQEIIDLEEQLLIIRASMKTLYGEEYRKAELEVIRIKTVIQRAKSFLEIAQYRSVANG